MIQRCSGVAGEPAHVRTWGSSERWWRPAAVTMALVLLPAVLGAQPHKLDRPADSPLWWTLTDELTPAELKQLLSDRTLTLQRYDAAVEAGLEQPLPERGPESRECLKYYFHTDLTPELEPMWSAFQVFQILYLPGENAEEEHVRAAPRDLRRFGVSASGVETILKTATNTAAAFDSLVAERAPKSQEMTILLRELYEDPLRAAAVPPEGQLYEAIRRKDYGAVAAAVGRPESEIRELVDSHADWDVAYARIAEALPGLKEELTESDWQGFRRYLLETIVVGGGSSKHFESYCGGSNS